MGDARYYLKIKCHSPEVAARILPDIEHLIDSLCRAYRFWQDNRGRDPDSFWKEFEKKFDLASKYLRSLDLFGTNDLNNLAGKLSYADIDDPDNAPMLSDTESAILYTARVWHLANWQPICDFIKSKFPNEIEYADWISEEYADLFDLL